LQIYCSAGWNVLQKDCSAQGPVLALALAADAHLPAHGKLSGGANGGVVPTKERDGRTDRRAAQRTEGLHRDGAFVASR
jgi:hypothetical protein